MTGTQKLIGWIVTALAVAAIFIFLVHSTVVDNQQESTYDQACIAAGGEPIRGSNISACITR